MRFTLVAALAGWLLVPMAFAAEPVPIVAVFDIENRDSGLSPRDVAILTNYLAAKLVEGGGFQIVPREEIHKRLEEQKLASYKQCYDESCQIELGRELAANFTLNTSIGKVGSLCLLTSALYDLKKSSASRSATAKAPCQVDELVNQIDVLVAGIKGLPPPQPKAAPPANDTSAAPPPEPPPVQVIQRPGPRTKSAWAALAWSILPGGGLYYTGHWFWGTVLGLSEVAGMLLAGLTAANGGDPAVFDIGLGFAVGGFLLTAGFGMLAAVTWEDPAYYGALLPGDFRPARDGRETRASHSAVMFPVFSARF
ncbi:MAG: hypothetical protein GYA21_01340 [Myxococcales bacterium]|nr:hypothetical protein [Myxococcales bacterium]